MTNDRINKVFTYFLIYTYNCFIVRIEFESNKYPQVKLLDYTLLFLLK
jgi:hypothetical protein